MKTQTKAGTLLHTFSRLFGLYLNKNTSLGQAVGCQGEKNVWQACRCIQAQPGSCALYHLCIYTTYSYSLNFFQIYYVMLSNVNESLCHWLSCHVFVHNIFRLDVQNLGYCFFTQACLKPNSPTAWCSHLHVALWEWCISFSPHIVFLQIQFQTQPFSLLSPFILALTIMWPTGNWMELLIVTYQKWFSSCYFWSDFSLKSLYKVRFSNVSILFSNLILL